LENVTNTFTISSKYGKDTVYSNISLVPQLEMRRVLPRIIPSFFFCRHSVVSPSGRFRSNNDTHRRKFKGLSNTYGLTRVRHVSIERIYSLRAPYVHCFPMRLFTKPEHFIHVSWPYS